MIIRLIFLLIAAAIVWGIVRSRYPVRVTLTAMGVQRSKNLPEPIKKRIDRFCYDNLIEGEELKLKGCMVAPGRIRWIFPKHADQGLAQRLRNFMATEVYF